MMLLFFDTETTGLLKPSPINIDLQPHILEICAIKTDFDFKVIDSINLLIKPPILIPIETYRIHGITDEMVEDCDSFAISYKKIANFFTGVTHSIAHNNSFDSGMLAVELMRIDKLTHFPWPINQICTVEASFHLKNRRMKLAELFELATGNFNIPNAHRAESDVLAMIEGLKWMVENEHYTFST